MFYNNVAHCLIMYLLVLACKSYSLEPKGLEDSEDLVNLEDKGIDKRQNDGYRFDKNIGKRKFDGYRFAKGIGKREIGGYGFAKGVDKREVDRFSFAGGIGKRNPDIAIESAVEYEKLGEMLNDVGKRSVLSGESHNEAFKST